MKTQIEEIVWHEWGKPNPKNYPKRKLLIQVMFDGNDSKMDIGTVIYYKKGWRDWAEQFDGKYEHTASVIAWAELPRGWVEK